MNFSLVTVLNGEYHLSLSRDQADQKDFFQNRANIKVPVRSLYLNVLMQFNEISQISADVFEYPNQIYFQKTLTYRVYNYMNMNRNMWRMNRVRRRIIPPTPIFFYILNKKYLGIVLFNVFSKISLFFHIIFVHVHVLWAEQIWKKKVFSNSKVSDTQ